MSRLDSFCHLIALRIYSYGAGHGYYYYYLSKSNHSPQNIPEPSIYFTQSSLIDSIPYLSQVMLREGDFIPASQTSNRPRLMRLYIPPCTTLRPQTPPHMPRHLHSKCGCHWPTLLPLAGALIRRQWQWFAANITPPSTDLPTF